MKDKIVTGLMVFVVITLALVAANELGGWLKTRKDKKALAAAAAAVSNGANGANGDAASKMRMAI